jgi:hypothetical protein
MTVGEIEAREAMICHIEEFRRAYAEHYGAPLHLIGDSTGTAQRYQLLRGYLLGKGYSFAEIDAPDGLWQLTRSTNV